jgi:asparagine synthase (glutamine-hydrolysing)
MLTGHGGDLVAGGNPFYLLDLARQCRLGRLWREVRSSPARLLQALRRYVLRPLLRSDRRFSPYVPAWIAPEFARRAKLASRQMLARPARRFSRLSQQVDYELVTLGQHSLRLLWLQSEGLHHGIDLRHPFLDQRLVEFLLQVPTELKVHEGIPKAILRRAMRDFIPTIVYVRDVSGGFAHMLDLALREQERSRWEACVLGRSWLVECGFVSVPALGRAFQRYVDGELELRDELARALRLELWLRAHLGVPAGGTVISDATRAYA